MDVKVAEIRSLEEWLLKDYVLRLGHIKRCEYLGIKPDESEYTLQTEAYNKEQRLRELKGLKPLPEMKQLIEL